MLLWSYILWTLPSFCCVCFGITITDMYFQRTFPTSQPFRCQVGSAVMGVIRPYGCCTREETLFFKFWRTRVLFVGLLVPLFWTSGDVSSGFQSQGGFLACTLSCFGTTELIRASGYVVKTFAFKNSFNVLFSIFDSRTQFQKSINFNYCKL